MRAVLLAAVVGIMSLGALALALAPSQVNAREWQSNDDTVAVRWHGGGRYGGWHGGTHYYAPHYWRGVSDYYYPPYGYGNYYAPTYGYSNYYSPSYRYSSYGYYPSYGYSSYGYYRPGFSFYFGR
jgi:hypothetical protein